MLAFSSIYFTSFSIHIIQLLIAALIACFVIQMLKFNFSTLFRSFFQRSDTTTRLGFSRPI